VNRRLTVAGLAGLQWIAEELARRLLAVLA
jgi:hypothetical protein